MIFLFGGGGKWDFLVLLLPKIKLWGVKCCCSHFKFVHI